MAKSPTAERSPFLLDQATRENGAAVFTETAELLTSTATAIWEKQLNLLRHEMEHAQKQVSAVTGSENASAAIEAYMSSVQGSIEIALTDMRAINDAMRDCAWRLFGLYAKRVQQGTEQFAAQAGQGAERLAERAGQTAERAGHTIERTSQQQPMHA